MPAFEFAAGPLTGIKVVDLSRGMAGAVATMLMADYGAEVLKIEHSTGDLLESSPGYQVWNRGKKGVALDLRDPEALPAVLELARTADVFLESFQPGVAERWGVGYSSIKDINPAIIYCSISTFGPSGPWAQRLGYEGLVSAASGSMTDQVGVRDGPMFSSIPLASLGASQTALHGILAALHVRNICGIGQKVETSLYQGAMAMRAPMLPEADEIADFQASNLLPQGGLPAYRMYPCSDGKWLHIGCLTREFWDKLAVALNLLELATEPEFESAPTGWSRDQDRELAMDLIGNRLLESPRDHWLQALAEADVPVAPVLTTQQFMDLPQVRANSLVQTVEDPILGRIDQVGLVIDFSETPGRAGTPASRPGQHTENLLAQLDNVWNSSRWPGNGAKSLKTPKYPLAGMKVLDFSSFIAAPLGAMVLSDLGADVIKVEPLSGEGARPLTFLILGGNRGKRSIAMDAKSPSAKEIINRLLASCDVVVHNMRGGIAERLGIDYETARNLRPDVIYVHVTGYGAAGADRLKPGFDPLFQSMSGITARQGARADRPVFLRTPVCDDTNALLLATGVMMALHHRDQTGQGQRIDMSLLKTAAFINSDDFVRHQGKADRPLADAGLFGMSAVKRLYKAADGWIFLDCNQAEEWESLRRYLGESLFDSAVTFDEANTMQPWNENLCQRLAEIFAGRPSDEWEQRLIVEGVPCCKVAENMDQGFFLHPQALHLGLIDHNIHPDYTNLRQVGVQVRFSETPHADRLPAPNLGQHSVEILQELGFGEIEISDMLDAGCIGIA